MKTVCLAFERREIAETHIRQHEETVVRTAGFNGNRTCLPVQFSSNRTPPPLYTGVIKTPYARTNNFAIGSGAIENANRTKIETIRSYQLCSIGSKPYANRFT
jgi:hypothetical protein